MQTICGLLWLSGIYPLWYAWQANRHTSLLHAVYWAMSAWIAWMVVAFSADRAAPVAAAAGSYVALCLTGCAAVAVLGARRPGVVAWNFVVVGLLAINLLPLAEGMVLGKPFNLDWMRILCVAATLAVGILNYLPTRLAGAGLVILGGVILQGLALVGPVPSGKAAQFYQLGGWFALALVPWLSFLALYCVPGANTDFDIAWLDFRNRFGLVWAQRLREQFNRSAEHAGWQVILRWGGLRLIPGATLPDPEVQKAIVQTLRALMKRFGPKLEQPVVNGSQ